MTNSRKGDFWRCDRARIQVYVLLEDGGPRLIGTVRAFDPVFYEQVAVDKPEENILGIRAKLRWIGKEVTGIYFDQNVEDTARKSFPGFEPV